MVISVKIWFQLFEASGEEGVFKEDAFLGGSAHETVLYNQPRRHEDVRL